jgi:hypothetical protein
MYQSVLVHQAESHRYRPGQEDTTRRILSSLASDAGIATVIYEPQDDPAMYGRQMAGAPVRLGTFPRQLAARLPLAAWSRTAGGQGSRTQEMPG